MGIILVFDLDQTIVDTETILRNNGNSSIFFPQSPQALQRLKQEIEAALNPTILTILKEASFQRYTLVDAILLLTNNSSKPYVAAVDSVLYSLCGNYGKYQTNNINDENINSRTMPTQRYFFDEIMMRHHKTRLPDGISERTAIQYRFETDLTKSLKDVKKMMEYLDIEYKGDSAKYYKENTYFFDDNPHIIDEEIDNSIRITPPFRIGREDRTDYSRILNRLSPNYTSTRVRPLTMASSALRVPRTLRTPSAALAVTRRGGRRIKKNLKKTRNRLRK